MNRAIGISIAAVLATVCGGIGLSLANTSSDSRWDVPLFASPVASHGYGDIPITPPKHDTRPAAPLRETQIALLSDKIDIPPAVQDIPTPQPDGWDLPKQGLAPLMASRPKSRASSRVAAVDSPAEWFEETIGIDTTPIPKQNARRTGTVSRSQTTHQRHLTGPRSSPLPDFLIGVYR